MSNINNINLNKKNILRYTDYKLNNNHNGINEKKKLFNKNKYIMTEKEKNQNINIIKNKKNLNIIRKFEKSKKTNILSLIKTIFIIIIMIFLIVFLTLKNNIKKKGIEKVNSKEKEKVKV